MRTKTLFRENDKIGPYTLKKKLGRGAFGVVWLVEKQTMAGSFEFALKLAARDDIDLAALQEEVSTWKAASGHPNVLPLIEADIHEDDYVIVSEYAPDGSLEKWLDDNGGRAPSFDEAIDLIIGILNGLEHLHSRNIIHRDLKPANILLQGNTPRLADFGVARILKSTQSTTIRGTVPYMSPDALKGSRTAQTDIWSVGVIFYHLLTGAMPYPQKEQVDLMYAILNEAPQPLPHTVPKTLREVIERALNKNSDGRYQSAKEMREAVRMAKQAKPEIVIEKATPQIRHEDENKTWEITSEETVLQTILDDRTVTQKPAPLLDTMLAPESQRVHTPKKIEAEKQLKISKKVWWTVGGIGVFVVLAVLATVIALVLVAPKIFKKNETPGTYTANLPNSVKLEMILIPAGNFSMGANNGKDDEKPVHNVAISKPFYIGKYEVTQRQWKAMMGDLPNRCYLGSMNRDDYPLICATWDDVQAFIKKLNDQTNDGKYRLPTEAEWEYAARAGTTGDYAGNLEDITWYDSNSNKEIHAVGMKKANAWGLYDMHGNVWEWCEDWYDSGYYANSPGVDPKGPNEGSKRIYRGGSSYDPAKECRSAARDSYAPANTLGSLGFRLVKTPL